MNTAADENRRPGPSHGSGAPPGVAGPLLPPRVVEVAMRLLPPIVVDAARRLPFRQRLVGAPEWEYVPEGWRSASAQLKGWNEESVLATERAKWPAFLRAVQGPAPLAVSHEMLTPDAEDYIAHNIIMAFAYVLSLAARRREALSVLDWGGGLGHYYVLASRLLEDVGLEYHCRDVPVLCRGGRELLPDVTFHEDDASCLGRAYDLVFASGSLQFAEDWKGQVGRLARATGSYLFVTRLPTVRRAASFVVVQRPYRYGYQTEYLGWFFNRDELLGHLGGLGMELVREFLVQEKPYVHGAPEQGQYRGFLFRHRPQRALEQAAA